MQEDEVLNRAIAKFTAEGWLLVYKTRPIGEGAIGGVDAILMKCEPWQFVFIDAKGCGETKEKRSSGFTNCLGALMKRIRFEHGYAGVEAADRFIPTSEFTAEDYRERLVEHGKHKNSQYVLAVTPELRHTVISSFDSALAALLHVRILLVSESGAEDMRW